MRAEIDAYSLLPCGFGTFPWPRSRKPSRGTRAVRRASMKATREPLWLSCRHQPRKPASLLCHPFWSCGSPCDEVDVAWASKADGVARERSPTTPQTTAVRFVDPTQPNKAHGCSRCSNDTTPLISEPIARGLGGGAHAPTLAGSRSEVLSHVDTVVTWRCDRMA